MSDNPLQPDLGEDAVQLVRAELAKTQTSKGRRIGEKFFLAALGAIPWVGGFIAAAASIPKDEADAKADDLRTKWLEEHQRKLDQLRQTLDSIRERFNSLGPDIEERIQSPEYLALVRQAFRVWDEAETEDKRQFVANVVSNSAGTRICSDDVVRL